MSDESGYSLKEMVSALRDWRHDKALPMLAAHESRLKVLETEMREISEVLVPKLNMLATKLDRADVVAAELRREKDAGFTRRQKIAVSLIGLAALVLQLVGLIVALTQ